MRSYTTVIVGVGVLLVFIGFGVPQLGSLRSVERSPLSLVEAQNARIPPGARLRILRGTQERLLAFSEADVVSCGIQNINGTFAIQLRRGSNLLAFHIKNYSPYRAEYKLNEGLDIQYYTEDGVEYFNAANRKLTSLRSADSNCAIALYPSSKPSLNGLHGTFHCEHLYQNKKGPFPSVGHGDFTCPPRN